jgi:hypothetical protein
LLILSAMTLRIRSLTPSSGNVVGDTGGASITASAPVPGGGHRLDQTGGLGLKIRPAFLRLRWLRGTSARQPGGYSRRRTTPSQRMSARLALDVVIDIAAAGQRNSTRSFAARSLSARRMAL